MGIRYPTKPLGLADGLELSLSLQASIAIMQTTNPIILNIFFFIISLLF
jgi:hypothetical protein